MIIYFKGEYVKKFLWSFIIFSAILPPVFPDNFYKTDPNVDVLHYRFGIMVYDNTDKIDGDTRIKLKLKSESSSKVSLDLHGIADKDTGMHVIEVLSGLDKLEYSHLNNKLNIILKKMIEPGEIITLRIKYNGKPEKGLIITKNKFDVKTFLGDNWPDKAHYWFPCIDHPSDKASCEFVISAPSHYQTVASGKLIESTDKPGNRRISHWKETAPVATKVMMICISHFAVNHQEVYKNIPVQTWVFPEEREEGFKDFSITKNVLEFYWKLIGKFSYAKIASVQAPTNFGGLENAGAISYYQNSVEPEGRPESLIAHEMAHQWFGDSVTESDWDHVWLSEGFATYFTAVYMEFNKSRDEFKKVMKRSRERVIKYFDKNNYSSIVDYKIKKLRGILNTNSYQKGSWFLHMLRKRVGDDTFFKGIRSYYLKYMNLNASTEDFKKCMENISGENLSGFFKQWVYNPGIPVIKWKWKFNKKEKILDLLIYQIQKTGTIYDVPLEIGIYKKGGDNPEKIIVRVNRKRNIHRIKLDIMPEKLELDPDISLLMKVIQ